MPKTVVLFFSSLVIRLSSVVCLSSFFCLLSILTAYANNMDVSNISLVDQSTSAGTIDVQFDISWSNSWRTTTNYDAAWVFIKYSTDAGTTWAHATLKTSGTNPSGFSRGTGTTLDIVIPTDKKGAFLQRTSSGSGWVSTTDIELVWDWSADGLSVSTTARVKVFAVEMVYIPTGSFYAGDPDGSSGPNNCFYTYGTGGAYNITSEDAINVGAVSGYFYYDVDGIPSEAGDQSGPIPAAFPKGYNAFYIMKYEISEGQWVDFFNTLTDAQKANRDITGSPGKNTDSVADRNTVSWTTGDATTTRPDRACNYLSWGDKFSYADWAALRPFTELEFEKAARGPLSASGSEYSWGNGSITGATTISGTEDGTETITNSNANCNYGLLLDPFTGGDGGQGPLRCGIFATASSTRQPSGSGYYGAKDLSGSLWEHPAVVGNSQGRSFTGVHGDGDLTTTPSNWPASDSATGAGARGGPFGDPAGSWSLLASRTYACVVNGATRSIYFGGRCARTAP